MRQSGGSSDVRKASHYTRLILPGALWILRFKRNIFLPFLSLDLCFLSVVTRTSRFSLRGKPREKQAGPRSNRWTPYPQQILSERFLLLSLPFFYSISTRASFNVLFLPLLCWSSGCCLLYKYMYRELSYSWNGHTHSFRHLLVRDSSFHYERIHRR